MTMNSDSILKAVWTGAVVLAVLISWTSSELPASALGEFPTGTSFGDAQEYSSEEAVELASRHISRQAARGAILEWQDAEAGPAVAYYDLQGALAAYVVEVIRKGQQAGYVTVSARKMPNPILEFGRSRAYHATDLGFIPSLIELGLSVETAYPRYLGALSYYYSAIRPGTGEAYLIEMQTGKPRPVSSLAVPQSLPVLSSGKLTAQGDPGVQAARTLVLTAPRYRQFWYGRCNTGSVPTAAGMLLSYWVERGYWNLIEGGATGDYKKAITKLHEIMGTSCDGTTGVTNNSAIAPALLSYATERGYSFSAQLLEAPTFDQFVAEISSSRLVIVNLVKSRADARHPAYGNASVTGIGYDYDPQNPDYRYMVISDTLSTSDRWLQYGINYASISLSTFIPPSPINAPLPAPTGTPLPAATPAPSYISPVKVSEDGVRSMTPAVAVDGAGVVHVVWSGRFPQKEEVFYRSWNGTAWSEIVNVSQNTGRSLVPSVAADSRGNVLVIWQDDTKGTLEILYRLWNGSDWSNTMNLTSGGWSFFPSVAVDPKGVAHVVWINQNGVNYRQLLGASPAEARLSVGIGDSWDPVVTTDATGNAHAVWHSKATPSESGILHRRWDGAAWSPIDNLRQNGEDSLAPSIAVDSSGNVHAVWQDNATTGNPRISYRRWNGRVWLPPEDISPDSGYPSDPLVAAGSDGSVHVVWRGNTSGNYEILHRQWNGSEWSPIENLSQNSGSSKHPRLAVDSSGRAHAVWEDDTSGTEEILYASRLLVDAGPARTPTPSPIPSPTPAPAPTLTATPGPVNPSNLVLASGWNLISIPRALANGSVPSVFGGVSTVEKLYEFSSGNWRIATFDGGAWSGVPIELVPGPAYWVKAGAPTTIALNYKPADPLAPAPPYPLQAGWNFIGYTTLTLSPAKPVSEYLGSLAGKWTVLYSYDPVAGFELSKPGLGFPNMELFRGYGVHLAEAATLVP
ncbi:MAG: hypothetical protein HYX92_01055 [Chloroflexi bacterium]|nr:hypothetical protein [Chloroflexota bacterium]